MRRQIARVARRLRRRLRGLPGVTVESKVAVLAVHYRGAPPGSRRAVADAVRVAVNGDPTLRLLTGKKVLEVMPAGPIDKARAVRFILRWQRRRARHVRWLPIYVGDDVADERVFATWRGLSILVGRRAGTAARYFVRSPDEVWRLLKRLEAA